MSSKVKIGSASRSSTDLSYFNREVKHRAQPPARGGRASAARRDRRWASRSSELRRWRQPSGSATGTGAVLAALVDGRACTDDGGAAALRPSSAFSQAVRKLRASLPCPFFAHGGVAFDGDCGAARRTGFAGLPRAPGAVGCCTSRRVIAQPLPSAPWSTPSLARAQFAAPCLRW